MLAISAQSKYRVLTGLAGLLVLAGGVSGWWGEWISSSQRIEAARQRISHVAWILSHKDELIRDYGKASAGEGLDSTFLSGPTEEQASTQLQQRLKQLIDASGSSIVTAQPLPARREGELIIPAVRYQVSASIAAMSQLFYLIENGRPFMFIDAADISAQAAQNAALNGSASFPPITLQLDVHAYARVPSHGT